MDHNLGANIRIYRKNEGFTQEETKTVLETIRSKEDVLFAMEMTKAKRKE